MPAIAPDATVGDKVVVTASHGHGTVLTRATIERLTQTQAIIKGARYNRASGRAVGEFTSYQFQPQAATYDPAKHDGELARSAMVIQAGRIKDRVGRLARLVPETVNDKYGRLRPEVTAAHLAAIGAALDALDNALNEIPEAQS